MIYTIVKYHRTESGEATSAVKKESMDAAVREYHSLANAYMADATVSEWSLAIIEPVEMRVIKRDHYIKGV